MPGPKMGDRPTDFDEVVIRQSPTFGKWCQLANGEKLRYACREFVKGQRDDEERLMRRIMIARRNNLRDHQVLKRARQLVHPSNIDGPLEKVPKIDKPVDTLQQQQQQEQETSRKRRQSTLFSDAFVSKEMDIPAVEATRSYRAWLKLQNGAEFVYNQKYIKGKEGHDWLLKKNIWRRMRYRRENKKMIEQLRHTDPATPSTTEQQQRPSSSSCTTTTTTGIASAMMNQTLLPPNVAAANTNASNSNAVTEAAIGGGDVPPTDRSEKDGDFEVNAAVEAAVAVAESYVKSPYNVVHNPLEATANTAALDAAARLAAAAATSDEVNAAVAAAEAAATAGATAL